MQIKKAVPENIDKIMEIVMENKKIMINEHNTQWDDTYPMKESFEEDIKNGELYKICEGEEMLGVICLNEVEAKEYINVNWSKKGPAIVVHRMCITPNIQKKGVGRKFIEFAEELAKEKKYFYIKADTYDENIKMNNFLLKCGFVKTGEVNLRKKPKHFNCYEKLL
ncbi:GNAT family N-acetyltransferase [Metaclostridioides mangenotii]|uniref:GNAT superfamily N-acetyltransferase n=1 Tax=Metaclostridioides mangenotii TaxID=1540 RepID=A0ABS4E9B3_9FIRM|nr:GNAT family N-acetyltransferase [Clostridioides mangenotii]MBP1854503.1 GNAT superfamily N-acetyltransferase [Clostridioides mangenotii]